MVVDVRAEDLRLDPELGLSSLLLGRRTERQVACAGTTRVSRGRVDDVRFKVIFHTESVRMSLLPRWFDEATTLTLKARFSKYSTTCVLNLV